MKPTRPIFKWTPGDATDPGYLKAKFAKWRRDYAAAWNSAHVENLERAKAAMTNREVITLKRAAR